MSTLPEGEITDVPGLFFKFSQWQSPLEKTIACMAEYLSEGRGLRQHDCPCLN